MAHFVRPKTVPSHLKNKMWSLRTERDFCLTVIFLIRSSRRQYHHMSRDCFFVNDQWARTAPGHTRSILCWLCSAPSCRTLYNSFHSFTQCDFRIAEKQWMIAYQSHSPDWDWKKKKKRLKRLLKLWKCFSRLNWWMFQRIIERGIKLDRLDILVTAGIG